MDFTNRNDDLRHENVENMVVEPRKRCTSIADLTEISIIKIRHGSRITTIKSTTICSQPIKAIGEGVVFRDRRIQWKHKQWGYIWVYDKHIYIYISLSLSRFILCNRCSLFCCYAKQPTATKYSKRRKRVVAGHPVCGCQAERSYCAMGSAQVPWRQPDPIGFMLKGETIANHFWQTWYR